jgi:AcrR family transcriptional regulator
MEQHVSAKRRAVTDEQKAQRRQFILEAAWALFQQRSYDEITVADVARAAGLAKGTVYLYFNSKEALFLAVEEQQLTAWFDGIDARLREIRDNCTIADLARLICTAISQRPGLARLMPILHVTLEHNIEYDTALAFKRMLLGRVAWTGALLEACLPVLRPGTGAAFVMQAYTFIVGLQQMADPAPVVKTLIEREPDMAPFRFDFTDACTGTLVALLLGIEAQADDPL